MAYQVAGKDDLCTIINQVSDGRHSGTDSGIIGDVQVVIQRNVQINSHKHPFPLQVSLLQSTHAPLGRHHSSFKYPPKKANQKKQKDQYPDQNFAKHTRKRIKAWNFGAYKVPEMFQRLAFFCEWEIKQRQEECESSRRKYRDGSVGVVPRDGRGTWELFLMQHLGLRWSWRDSMLWSVEVKTLGQLWMVFKRLAYSSFYPFCLLFYFLFLQVNQKLKRESMVIMNIKANIYSIPKFYRCFWDLVKLKKDIKFVNKVM